MTNNGCIVSPSFASVARAGERQLQILFVIPTENTHACLVPGDDRRALPPSLATRLSLRSVPAPSQYTICSVAETHDGARQKVPPGE